MRVFGFFQWYQWYTNIVQGFTNGTIGNTICTIGNANGNIGSPNGTIDTIGKPMAPLVSKWYHWLPMVPLVKSPMLPLGDPGTEPMLLRFRVISTQNHFGPGLLGSDDSAHFSIWDISDHFNGTARSIFFFFTDFIFIYVHQHRK